MDFYERFGKFLSEKIDSQIDEAENETKKSNSALNEEKNEFQNENATETVSQTEKKTKTLGDVGSVAFLFNENKEKSTVGEIVRDYTEETPVKIITDAEVIIKDQGNL